MPATKPKVSVIIPIYNVEEYLAECLDSVLAQTMRDIEVICVNDGSTDGSPAIIERYAAADPRIVVIDKPNGGYGHSVNRGLEIARGEWLSIVEPDDLVDSRMYEDLLRLSDTPDGPADIVKGSYWLYFAFEGRQPYVQRPNLMNCMPQGFCELHIQDDPEVLRHHPSIWSAIYRSDFIRENGIRMIEPKGAGWADNPWFFQTMLAAKRIMWTPAPYYRYRQTNPDASSKLKDFHLPFDRLRDIRAIYEQHGITNRLMVEALYQRSFDYICTSLLEEFGFPENDPEMQQLIREVLDTFDPDLLLDEKCRIPQRRKDYYKDFMGLFLEEVDVHAACADPKISFVVAMRNDRRGLWETLKVLLNQSFEDFEVICVDCESPDRSAEIARGIAERDRRFSLVRGATSVADGYAKGLAVARGEYVQFLRPGVTFADRRVVRDLNRALQQLENPADVVVYGEGVTNARLLPRTAKFDCVSLELAGVETDVLLAAKPFLYTRMFSRSFLMGAGPLFGDSRDPDGWTASVVCAAHARTAAFVNVRAPRTETKDLLEEESMHSEDELIAWLTGRYDAIAACAERLGNDAAWRVARSCITRSMSEDIALIGRYRSGERFFEAMRDAYETGYGIKAVPLDSYANYLDIGVLEEAFSLPYEDYAKRVMTQQHLAVVELTRQRDRANRKAKRLKTSGSYLFGRTVSQAAKAVVPKQIIRKAVDAGVDRSEKAKE